MNRREFEALDVSAFPNLDQYMPKDLLTLRWFWTPDPVKRLGLLWLDAKQRLYLGACLSLEGVCQAEDIQQFLLRVVTNKDPGWTLLSCSVTYQIALLQSIEHLGRHLGCQPLGAIKAPSLFEVPQSSVLDRVLSENLAL